MSMTKNSEHIPYENADWNTGTGGTKTAAALMFIGAMASGCQENDLRPLPKPRDPWTESCFDANGEVVTPWGSVITRHAVHRAVQADAGRDTDDPSDNKEVTDSELLQRECLVAHGFYEAGQQRCAGDGTVSTINGMVFNGPDGLRVVMDAARDESGNQSGYFPGGECRPSTDFDNSGFELPLIATTNWDSEVGFTLSFMHGNGAGNGSGVPPSNIPTQETPSLPDDGSRNWAHEYREYADSDGEPDVIYEDEWGNELTHAPWMEKAVEMINAGGEQSTALRGWCLRPNTHADVLAAYLNDNGCVVPPTDTSAE